MNLQTTINEHRTRMKYSNRDLLHKLQEEMNEVMDAKNATELKYELADLTIMAFALATYHKIDLTEAIYDKMEKREQGIL